MFYHWTNSNKTQFTDANVSTRSYSVASACKIVKIIIMINRWISINYTVFAYYSTSLDNSSWSNIGSGSNLYIIIDYSMLWYNTLPYYFYSIFINFTINFFSNKIFSNSNYSVNFLIRKFCKYMNIFKIFIFFYRR